MIFRLLFLLSLILPLAAAGLPLTLSQTSGKPESLRLIGTNTWELQTADDISLIASLPTPAPVGDLVIEFEYFCLGELPRFPVIPGPPFESRSARWSPALVHSETWTPHRIRLSPSSQPLPANCDQFRFKLAVEADLTLRLRNLHLRTERAGEFDQAKPGTADTSARLSEYLDASFPARIEHISLEKDTIRIRGQVVRSSNRLSLAEIPMESLLVSPDRFKHLTPIDPAPDGSFTISLSRHPTRDGRIQDRIAAKWQIVDASSEKIVAASHARYPDDIHCIHPKLPAAKPGSKKGLGGWHLRSDLPNELEDLGIAAVTVNIMVDSVISPRPGRDSFPITWQGQTYHANRKALNRYDATFREAARQGQMVSAILLISNPARSKNTTSTLLGHPDAVEQGTYAMPNVTSTNGINLYAAALNLMASRWTRPDEEFGRVHHWIVHNEVDAGWVWTNCGDKELLPYIDLYHRSARLIHLIARQYDPNARAFISLTHHWAKTVNSRFYPSREVILAFSRISRTEGDFQWALAHHPYPQSLRKPRTWEDNQATDSFDTDKITPHNIEVLDRWMRTPEMRFLGTETRKIHLSENGFNSPDYSEESLHDQAAGMAYAWKKISNLDSIESWQYHNWIDNRKEGGLRIGLRRFPDDKDRPLGKKPIWHLYQALATPDEDEACLPYLSTVKAP